MHEKLPMCLFANCGDKAAVFDLAADSVCRTLEQPFVATAVDWWGNVVCMGVAGGVQVSRIDWSGEGSSTWQLYAMDTSLKGQQRCAVEVVACSSGDKAFSAAENHSLHVWDYTRTQPTQSVAVWSLGVRCACASVDPGTGTQCLLGSARGSAVLIDYRLRNKSSGFVWRIPQAHDAEGVACVAWHPHVSHWFASGGADGSVRVWDSRAVKTPVAEAFLAHAGGVSSVAWCPGHSELLASVGTDRSAALWNWRLAPVGRLRLPAFGEHRLLGVGWTEATMVAGDSRGNLATATMGGPLLQPMCPRSSTSKEDAIRRLLYARDLAAAFPLVVERAQHLMASTKVDEALELVESCYPRRLAAPDLSAPSEAPAAFARDIVMAASFLPPGYAMPAHASRAMRSIKKLRVMLLLQQMRAKEMWREAMGFTDELVKSLHKAGDKKSQLEVDPEIVRETVAMVMRHHHLGGLTMGAKILRAVKEEEFARFSGLTRLLLSPTVFDGYVGGGLAQASTDLDYVLTSSKVGLSQVDFVRDFTSRMWNSEAPFARVDKMMKKTEHTLVSVCATVNRVYLGALLQTSAYAKFFAAAATVTLAAPNCDFSGSVLPATLIAKGTVLAGEWSSALLEELRGSFVASTARALMQLLMCMLSARVAPLLPRHSLDAAGKVLAALVKIVPDAAAAGALQYVALDAGPSQSEDVKTALAVLSLKQVN